MKRGVWHQCGDKSQKLVKEQLENGAGVGVIISPRDLSQQKSMDYSSEYAALGAEILLDPQFHVPTFSNEKLESYELSEFRKSVSALNRITDTELTKLSLRLQALGVALGCTGLIAPAVVYEAGRDDIIALNARLFNAAKSVGDILGIPTLGTVILGRSIGSADGIVATSLSAITGLNADGWYYGFEFEDERIPSSREDVIRYLSAGLTLACTGKPVLHAYAGPMGLLSFGVGACAVGIGHSQNLWKFTRERWETPKGQGGGGDAPARFFSSSLWGTIIYPDETTRLSNTIRSAVLTHSPFSSPVASSLSWSKWDANKHLVSILCGSLTTIASHTDPIQCADQAAIMLTAAIALHGQIAGIGITLADNTNRYQQNWKEALSAVLSTRQSDFEYLALLR